MVVGSATSSRDVTFRYNPEKAGSTEFGHSAIHDMDDSSVCVKQCYDTCGCFGVALLAILAVGAALLSASSGESSDHCLEVCTYDSLGNGICKCLFG